MHASACFYCYSKESVYTSLNFKVRKQTFTPSHLHREMYLFWVFLFLQGKRYEGVGRKDVVCLVLSLFCGWGFFVFNCNSGHSYTKGKKTKIPRISGGRGCVLLKVRIKWFSQNSIFKSDILTAEKFSIMEQTVLKDVTVKDRDLLIKLLSWPGVAKNCLHFPGSESSAVSQGMHAKMAFLYKLLSEVLCWCIKWSPTAFIPVQILQ